MDTPPAQRTAFLAAANLSDIGRELGAQIDAVVNAGLAPTHLDWHCLADGGRADIFDLGAWRLPRSTASLRGFGSTTAAAKAPSRSKPVVDNAFLDSFCINLDDKAETYERMLRDLPQGLNEWAVHPAEGTEHGWRSSEAGESGKATMRASLHHEHADPAQEGITVIGYRPLQHAWNGLPRRRR